MGWLRGLPPWEPPDLLRSKPIRVLFSPAAGINPNREVMAQHRPLLQKTC